MSYVIQTGDTIRAVTGKLGCSFRDLMKTNPGAFGRTKDGRWFLKAGRTLQTAGADNPASIDSRSTSTATSSSISSDKAQSNIYIVKQGETVGSVCRKLGLPFNTLRQLNSDAVAQTGEGRWYFKTGARLFVPGTFSDALNNASKNNNGPAPTAENTTSAKEVIAGPHPLYHRMKSGNGSYTIEKSAKPVESAEFTVKKEPPSAKSQEIDSESVWRAISSKISLEGAKPSAVNSWTHRDAAAPVAGSKEEVMKIKYQMNQDLNLTFSVNREAPLLDNPAGTEPAGVGGKAFMLGLEFRF